MSGKSPKRIFKNRAKPYGNKVLVLNVLETLIKDQRENNRYISAKQLRELVYNHCGYYYTETSLRTSVDAIANMVEFTIDAVTKRVGKDKLPVIHFRLIYNYN